MNEIKEKLEIEYPMLKRMEKYKYVGMNEKEIIDCIKKEFGREFKIQNEEVMELEI